MTTKIMNADTVSKAHSEITQLLVKYTGNEDHHEFITAMYAQILLFEQVAKRGGRADLINDLRKAAVTYRTVVGLSDSATIDAFKADNI